MTEDPIGNEGGINYFGYSYNNPIKQFDSMGLKVWIAGHLAAKPFGYLTKPQSFHLFLYLDPDDKKQCQGFWPMTLGAQWDKKTPGHLIGKVNYLDDNFQTADFKQEVKLPKGMDCCIIWKIIAAAAKYKNKLPYSTPYNRITMPNDISGVMDIDTYNSNSYVSGVLQEAGIRPPILVNKYDKSGDPFQIPGYQNPIPISKGNR